MDPDDRDAMENSIAHETARGQWILIMQSRNNWCIELKLNAYLLSFISVGYKRGGEKENERRRENGSVFLPDCRNLSKGWLVVTEKADSYTNDGREQENWNRWWGRKMEVYGGEKEVDVKGLGEKWDSKDQEVTCYAVRGKCSLGWTLSRDYRYTFEISVLAV